MEDTYQDFVIDKTFVNFLKYINLANYPNFCLGFIDIWGRFFLKMLFFNHPGPETNLIMNIIKLHHSYVLRTCTKLDTMLAGAIVMYICS